MSERTTIHLRGDFTKTQAHVDAHEHEATKWLTVCDVRGNEATIFMDDDALGVVLDRLAELAPRSTR